LVFFYLIEDTEKFKEECDENSQISSWTSNLIETFEKEGIDKILKADISSKFMEIQKKFKKSKYFK
jgi:hypothetical protein